MANSNLRLYWILLFGLCVAFTPLQPNCEAQSASAARGESALFRITVVDAETGRGIPLVRLVLTNRAEYFTDSAGVVAFNEPDLIGKDVSIQLDSYGYSYPLNWLRQPEVRVRPEPGGSVRIEMQRQNIAQRLYRLSGAGVYRDSQILGDEIPPVLQDSDAPVMGIDSVLMTPFKGRLFWVWGDTGITATNLGNFRSTAAWSDFPDKGGLDPDVGVQLHYFQTERGWPKNMFNDPHHPIWMGSLIAVPDANGQERLFASYSFVKPPLGSVERGICEFNEEIEQFDKVQAFSEDDLVAKGGGHPFHYTIGGKDYAYYPLPGGGMVRAPARAEALRVPSMYEAFTCLTQGSDGNSSTATLARDEKGRLLWGWRRNTSPVWQRTLRNLLTSTDLTQEDLPSMAIDVQTGKPFDMRDGSVSWNEYRQRYMSIRLQNFGDSWLGEIWYCEADTPIGPWVYAQKVVTHARTEVTGERRVDEDSGDSRPTYAFYNPKHHPEFEKDGGRVVYFEGTFTMQFSSAKHPVPYYNYNQIMYKLELDDPRLMLPVPVYRIDGEPVSYRTRADLGSNFGTPEIAFWAPDRPRPGTEPVYEVTRREGRRESVRLTMNSEAQGERLAFYAEPIGSTDASEDAVTIPLYEFVRASDGARIYATDEMPAPEGFTRMEPAICRVWPRKVNFNPWLVAN